MREVLFRGKVLASGSWVFGYFYRNLYGVTYIVSHGDPNRAITFHPVDPNTVGQFTGVFDKNEKKVFEGDLLLNTGEDDGVIWEEVSVVKYVQGCAVAVPVSFVRELDNFNKSDLMRFVANESLCTSCDEAEVIGNIYE